jgi:hypothetical protein
MNFLGVFTMKLSATKIERIAIDLEELPDEIYSVLVGRVVKEINCSFCGDGTISFGHDWSDEWSPSEERKLSDLARDAVSLRMENSELQTMLFEIRAAEKIILEAMK